MSISLTKSSVINLSKQVPGLSKVVVGLGWDPVGADEKKGFFGRILGGSTPGPNIDCDAAAILLSNGVAGDRDTVYFGNLRHNSGSVVHSGDNLTGEGDGDDEQIIVNLKDVPSKYDKIILFVNIYRGKEKGQTFSKIKNAFVRIVDASNNKEICRYDISNTKEYSDVVTMTFGELIKVNGEWEFRAVGEPHSAQSISVYSANYR